MKKASYMIFIGNKISRMNNYIEDIYLKNNK